MTVALVLVWLAAFTGLAVLGYPIAARLFPRFPDRGAGFALPVALVAVTSIVFWLGRLSYGRLTVAVAVLALSLASVAAALDLDALREGELVRRPELSVESGPVRDVGVVFLLAFLFLVSIRAIDPAVHAIGGEKYLDFGLLRSLLRSPTLPPEDVWFAGEQVRYYYGGHLIASILTYVTGTEPRFAYNLALAGFYAMLVTAAFSLAGAVAASRGRSRVVAGAFAAFFVGVASNLEPAAKLLAGFVPAGIRTGLVPAVKGGTWYYTLGGLEAQFSYWDASRVIPGTINEFPLFAWLNGDLHAHMMGTPFLLLAAALAFALYLTPIRARRRRHGLLGAIAVVGALQAVVDTWSFPSVFGLAWLALTFSPAPPWTLAPASVRERVWARVGDDRLREEVARPLVAGVVVAVVAALAVVVAAPFFLNAVLGGAGNRTIALLPTEMRSTLGGFLLVHGAFLVLFAAFALDRLDASRLAVGLGAVLLVGVGVGIGFPALGLAGPVLAAAWVLGRMDDDVGYEAVLLAAGAGLVLVVELVFVKEQAGPGRMNTVFKSYMQIWVLWATAAGVVVSSLSTPAGFGGGLSAALDRLLGRSARADEGDPATGTDEVAGGCADGGSVVDDDRSGISEPRPETGTGDDTGASWLTSRLPRRSVATELLVVLLVLATTVYGPLAVAEHVATAREDPTLDATQFAEETHPAEARAIAWLDERATSSDVLLSAPGTSRYPTAESGSYPYPPGMYSWGSNPAASLTGVPTVAGWAHEVGYRGGDAYFARVNDVDRAYTDKSAAVAALTEYEVTYVYVGPTERERYGANLIDFAAIQGVEVAYENRNVVIYRVDHSELPDA